jgi:hypothetical protein
MSPLWPRRVPTTFFGLQCLGSRYRLKSGATSLCGSELVFSKSVDNEIEVQAAKFKLINSDASSTISHHTAPMVFNRQCRPAFSSHHNQKPTTVAVLEVHSHIYFSLPSPSTASSSRCNSAERFFFTCADSGCILEIRCLHGSP